MYGNGGGGHKATAIAVKEILENCSDSHLLHVELIDASKIAGATFGDWLYNVLLSLNAVSVIEAMHAALHTFIFPIAQPCLRRAFRAHFAKTPDIRCVVSFVPILNHIMADVLQPSASFFTVITDFSSTLAHPWIQHPRQHIVAGTDIAVAQAIAEGYVTIDVPSASLRLTATSGMVVNSQFYNHLDSEARRLKRADLGLVHDLPTVLVLFGGAPPTDRVERLVELFLARKSPHVVNVIAVCARNRALYDRLRRRWQRNKHPRLFFTGFTTEIPLFMQLSDVLVGKPGPGVASEAFVSGLPSILVTGSSENNVMKQEKDVLSWVRRHGVGVVVRSERDAAKVSEAQIKEMREKIMKMPRNRAVFEVRDLILSSLHLSENPCDEQDANDDASVDKDEIQEIEGNEFESERDPLLSLQSSQSAKDNFIEAC